jgi:membrane protein YqaA with SNARE-associated domain
MLVPKSTPGQQAIIKNHDMLLKILTVAGLATFQIYAAIPTGFALGLSAWEVFFASATGGLTGAFVAAFLGEKIRKFLYKNKRAKEKNTHHPMLYHIWNKYGIIGLGLLGTFSFGAPICIAAGVGLNANLKKLLPWCCISVVSRCVVFTLVGYYGFKLF